MNAARASGGDEPRGLGHWRAVANWARRKLWATPFDAAITLLLVGALVAIVPAVLDWLLWRAVWPGSNAAGCAAPAGACWTFLWERREQFLFGAYPASEHWRIYTGTALALAGLIAMPFVPRRHLARAAGAAAASLVAAGTLFTGGTLGLAAVATSAWGGLFLSLLTGVTAFVTALPIGIALALGRESHYPPLRAACTVWIELWRSVPTLVVLFVAIIMLPLFLPVEHEIDKYVRALVAFSILTSCQIAEAVRGALHALPRDQYESARALGLDYWQTMGLVILPQALTIAVPAVTSIAIGLIKETSLLVIIGFSDLLGTVQSATLDPVWSGTSARATGYVFVAGVFWIACFAVSRWSLRIENHTRVRWHAGSAR